MSSGRDSSLDQRNIVHVQRLSKSDNDKLSMTTSPTEKGGKHPHQKDSNSPDQLDRQQSIDQDGGTTEPKSSNHGHGQNQRRIANARDSSVRGSTNQTTSDNHKRPFSNSTLPAHNTTFPSMGEAGRQLLSPGQNMGSSHSTRSGILRKPSIGLRYSSDVEEKDEVDVEDPPLHTRHPCSLQKSSAGPTSSLDVNGSRDDQTPELPVPTKRMPEPSAPAIGSSILRNPTIEKALSKPRSSPGADVNSRVKPKLLRNSSTEDSDPLSDEELMFDQHPQQQEPLVSASSVDNLQSACKSEMHDDADNSSGASEEEEEANPHDTVHGHTYADISLNRDIMHHATATNNKNVISTPVHEFEEEASVCTFQDDEQDAEQERVHSPRCKDDDEGDHAADDVDAEELESGGEEECDPDHSFCDPEDMVESEHDDDSDESNDDEEEVIDDANWSPVKDKDILKASTKKTCSMRKAEKTVEDDDDGVSSSFAEEFSEYSAQDLWEENGDQKCANPLELPFELPSHDSDSEELESEYAITMTPLGLESPAAKKEKCDANAFAAFESMLVDNDSGRPEESEVEIESEESSDSEEKEEDEEEEEDDEPDVAPTHAYGRKTQERQHVANLRVTDYGDRASSEALSRDQKLKPKSSVKKSPKPGLLQATLKAVIPTQECASDDESACLSLYASSSRRKGEAFDFEPVYRRDGNNSSDSEGSHHAHTMKKGKKGSLAVGRYLRNVVKHARWDGAAGDNHHYESDSASVNTAQSKGKQGLLNRNSRWHAQRLNS